MRLRRGHVRYLILLVALLAGPDLPVLAQDADPREDPARDQLYAELAEDVAEIERMGAVLKKVVQLIRPTVVHIEAMKTEGPFVGRVVEEAGSGVIVRMNDSHYILTNRHVIRNSPLSQITIRLSDGRSLRPQQKWEDRDTDIAVMAVSDNDLIAARLGDSAKIDIGDFVLAVGSPFGLSHSVTFGIVSAKGRRDLKLGGEEVRFQSFFQTDAAINPGNSGGPLLNLRGEVVGINTAIASNSGGNEGIGFSIPIHIATNVAQQLVESGRVRRAFLGVILDVDYNEEAASRLGLPRRMGALVKDIAPDSAAQRAELQVGDVVLEFDGVRIDDDDHLVNQVSLTAVGREVAIVVFRDGRPMTLRVTVGEQSRF